MASNDQGMARTGGSGEAPVPKEESLTLRFFKAVGYKYAKEGKSWLWLRQDNKWRHEDEDHTPERFFHIVLEEAQRVLGPNEPITVCWDLGLAWAMTPSHGASAGSTGSAAIMGLVVQYAGKGEK